MNKARQRLRQLQIRNIRLHHADGTIGLPEYGPYEGILVAAAPEILPKQLLEQLTIGGRLIIPAGGGASGQILFRITRTKNGYEKEELEHVSFVPLLGGLL